MTSDGTMPLEGRSDLARMRAAIREECESIAMSGLRSTRLITAAMEIAQNVLRHADGGGVTVERVTKPLGVRVRITDRGAGITDVERAFTPGFSSGSGLGLGLSGARGLSDEFEFDTGATGTSIQMVVWR